MAELTALLATLERLELRAPPAPPEDLGAAETRLGTALPSEVVTFYERSDGFQRSTPVERGWVRLWMLTEWRPVREFLKDSMYAAVGDAQVFADHCDESWWYAFDLCQSHGAIYIVDGLRPPRLVAHSLIAFVDDVLADRDSIYPREDAAVQR